MQDLTPQIRQPSPYAASRSDSTEIPWRFRQEPSLLDSEEIDTLRKWCLKHWQPQTGIVQAIKEDSPERRLLVKEATRLSLRNGVQAGRVRTWANLQPQDLSDGEYPSIYPHKHFHEPGITLVFYLACDADSPPLEILADDGSIEVVITPEVGTVAMCRNGVYHQVRKNRSPKDRIAAIVEVYPK